MFESPESEKNGQFKYWLKKVGNIPITQKKIVWGYVKACLGLEAPQGILADERAHKAVAGLGNIVP